MVETQGMPVYKKAALHPLKLILGIVDVDIHECCLTICTALVMQLPAIGVHSSPPAAAASVRRSQVKYLSSDGILVVGSPTTPSN